MYCLYLGFHVVFIIALFKSSESLSSFHENVKMSFQSYISTLNPWQVDFLMTTVACSFFLIKVSGSVYF